MKTQVKLKKDFHTVVRASVLSRLHHCQVLYSGMTHASLRRLRAVKIMKLVGIFNLNSGLSALINSLNSSFTLISNIHCWLSDLHMAHKTPTNFFSCGFYPITVYLVIISQFRSFLHLMLVYLWINSWAVLIKTQFWTAFDLVIISSKNVLLLILISQRRKTEKSDSLWHVSQKQSAVTWHSGWRVGN